MADLKGRKVAFLATDMVEQVELTEPWKAVEDAGGKPELVSLESGEIQGFNHYDKADTFHVDRMVGDVSARSTTLSSSRAASGTPTRCAWTTTPSTSCVSSSAPASRWARSAMRRGCS